MDYDAKYRKRIHTCLEKIDSEPQYAPNRDTCHRFVAAYLAAGRSPHVVIKYLDMVRYISGIVPAKDFKVWDRRDVEKVMSHARTHMRPWTIDTYIVMFKRFWRFLFDLCSADRAPDAVRWLEREEPETEITKEDLLTREEIQAMMDSTKSIEHKALFSILSAGARPCEIRSIRFGDIQDLGSILKVYVQAKKVGRKKNLTRPVYPGAGFMANREHADYVRQLVKQQPDRDDPKALLFPRAHDEWMRRIVLTAGAKAGLIQIDPNSKHPKRTKGKPLKPYLFRHTYGTWAYKYHNTAYARRLMGHGPKSKMERIYCHLAQEDLEEALLGKLPVERPDNVEARATFAEKWLTFSSEKRCELMNMFSDWLRETGCQRGLEDFLSAGTPPGSQGAQPGVPPARTG